MVKGLLRNNNFVSGFKKGKTELYLPLLWKSKMHLPVLIPIFIVYTEEWYGGKIKAFRERDMAESYLSSLNVETLILEEIVEEHSQEVFVFVTEEWFGGANGIKVFREGTHYVPENLDHRVMPILIQ